MSEQKIKVFTFSQQPLFQEGVSHALATTEDIQIIGQARITDKMLIIEVMPPDVAIIDIDILPDNGLSLVNRLKQLLPSVGVIVLTSSPSDDHLLRALEAQVAAYISKETSSDELANIVRHVARGEAPIHESLTNHPGVVQGILHEFQELSRKTETETLISPLTARETEILNYVAQGYSNKQIADKLNTSDQTIKNHVSSILTKLNANARTQAVVKAVQQGLISID